MSIASANPTVAVSYVVSEGTSEGYRQAILELTATVVARLESRGVHVVQVNAAEADQAASELLASVDDAWANHSVDIVSGTKVAAMLGDEPIDARVGHHQAVDRVGDGLLVSARAEDGVVEAVESAEGWIVGVQWHPEEAKADQEALDRLIDGFLGAIAERQPQVA